MNARLRILLLFVLAGFLSGVLISGLRNKTGYLSPRQKYLLSLEIISTEKENAQIREKLQQDREKIVENRIALEDIRFEYADIIRKEIELLRAFKGETDLMGEGVVLFVTDSSRDLRENENPNRLVVHDIDIQNIVTELRNAGAEAISINDERVLLGHSKILCVGPGIRVNSKILSPPFVIKAIGNSRLLEAAVTSPDSFTQELRGWGLFVEVNTAISVEIVSLKP